MAQAIVLLSGGLDSAVCLYWARRTYGQVAALSFDYGQRHRTELHSAQLLAERCGVVQRTVSLDLQQFGGSSLTDMSQAVPVAEPDAPIAAGIPSTYVPVRNLVFLSLAAAWAESIGAHAVVIGVNAVDYSGYPDCRPEFISAFARAAHLASKATAEGRGELAVVAPLQHASKADIVRQGMELGVPFELTSSCYQPAHDGSPCMRCDSCRIRRAAFAAQGLADPRAQRYGL